MTLYAHANRHLQIWKPVKGSVDSTLLRPANGSSSKREVRSQKKTLLPRQFLPEPEDGRSVIAFAKDNLPVVVQ